MGALVGSKYDQYKTETGSWGFEKRQKPSTEESWQEKLVDELHKPIKRNFTRRRNIVNHINEIWAADLVEMQQLSKWNKSYRYLLMVIDIFSKYGWVVPLKDKKGETVTKAFQSIFKEVRKSSSRNGEPLSRAKLGVKPEYLWTDKGSEFYNKHMKDLLNKHNIKLYSTENEEKSSGRPRINPQPVTDLEIASIASLGLLLLFHRKTFKT